MSIIDPDKTPAVSASQDNPAAPSRPSLTPWHWGWSAALALIVLATLAFRYALPIRDGDLWWHMLYGKYFLENHTIVADHTIFSWTPTTNDTIYCTWLPDIFLYLLHKVAGLPGIFAFRYLCILVPVLGCFLHARKLRVASHPLVWFIALLAVIMSYTAIYEKPEILSFVFMTLLAWNWWHIRSSGDAAWRNCYLFPVIMLAWVNTHGGFVFGAVFLSLIGIGELLNTWLSPQNVLSARLRKHLLLALLLAATTPLLTPYGYHYPVQLFYDFLPTAENANFNNKIAAYASPFAFENPHNFVLTADITILLLAFLLIRNIARVEWSTLISNLVFAFLYTRFFRTTFYWVPIFLFSGITLLAVRPLASEGWRYAQLFTRLLPGVVLAAAVCLSGHTQYRAMVMPEKWLWMGFGISDSNPVAEADYIATHFPNARIGNTYDQGAYLLWKLWPHNKVFFDARHFPYRDWSDDFFAFSRGDRVKPILDKYPCDIWCIGLHNSQLIKGLLGSKKWKIAFVGKNSAVLARKDLPLPDDAPRVSHDLYEQKNLASAIDLIAFAIIISGWDMGEHLLAVMQNTFKWEEQQKSIQWAKYNLYGFRAYLKTRDYRTAIENLEQVSDPPTYTRFVITNCYQFLTEQAWKKNDMAGALKFARRSLALVPDNPYSLYNVGIILWQQEQTLPPEKQRGDWRQFLIKFLRSAPSGQDFDAFRPIVKEILDGKHPARPKFLIPPEPIPQSVIDPPNGIATIWHSHTHELTPFVNSWRTLLS